MLKKMRVVVFLLLLLTLFYGITHKECMSTYMSFMSRGNILYGSSKIITNTFTDKLNSKPSHVPEKKLLGTNNGPSTRTVDIALRSPYEVLGEGDGIILLESTDRLQPPALVLCAIESAARVYKNRPVAFFMKGLNNTNIEETVKRNFPALSSLSNVYFFPLKMDDLFTDTPLHAWYQKIDQQKQSYWTYVSSDACRLALIWKYGGIYFDADVISARAIPSKDFLASTSATSQVSSNIFGFPSHHDFIQKMMKDFVQNYNSRIWGNQGPLLFSRVLKKFYDVPKFTKTEDVMFGNITLFNRQRFYPIPYPAWRKYYTVWDRVSTYNNSYAFHLWNYMNNGKVTMVPGSNTLAEFLHKEYCPSTYNSMLSNYTTYH